MLGRLILWDIYELTVGVARGIYPSFFPLFLALFSFLYTHSLYISIYLSIPLSSFSLSLLFLISLEHAFLPSL